MKLRNLTSLFLGLLVAVSMVACSDDSTSEFETLRAAADEWLTNSATGPIGASSVMPIANQTAADHADYQIVSVRKSADYTNGHLPTAINIPWTTIGDDGALANLDSTKTIIDYCYTSNTGSVAMVGLNLMGYTTKNMKYGMMGYNNQVYTVPGSGDENAKYGGYAESSATAGLLDTANVAVDESAYISTTATTASPDYNYPELATGESTAVEIARARYKAYATAQAATFDFVISAADVKTIVDANDSNYQIVSVRSAAAYDIGHIPGAINIPWKTIAQEENLKKLDPNKTIIVYCYTGHTGGQTAAVLNLLGYKARNLKFGMEGWSKDDTVMVGDLSFSRFVRSLHDPYDDPAVTGDGITDTDYALVK